MPPEVLRHILDEVVYLEAASRDLDRDAFLTDATRKRAFARSLEVIGEAAKQVPASFREAHPEIDWRGMAGMRDRLIHRYFSVDYELVWDVVSQKVPKLRAQLEVLLG